VLVFTPHFPTYGPNIERRGARAVYSPLRQANQFRPDLDDVKRFLRDAPRARAIFLNSPHNPTGGVATADDLRGLADLVRGRDVAAVIQTTVPGNARGFARVIRDGRGEFVRLAEGSDAMLWSGSVRLKSTWHDSHDDVPT